MRDLFILNCVCTIVGSSGVLIYFFMNKAIEKKQSANWKYSLSKSVVLLFIIPIHLIILSLFNYYPSEIQNNISLFTTSIDYVSKNMISELSSDLFLQQPEIYKSIATHEVVSNPLFNVSFSDFCMIVWVIGMIVSLLWYCVCYRKFKKELTSSKKLESTPTFNSLKTTMNIKKPIEVYRNESCASPMLVGIFTYKLILNKNLSEKSLDYVLKHELVHLKRNDLWWKYLFLFIKIVHWYNPLVYLFEKPFDINLEQSCDEIIVNDLSSFERKEYAHTILDSVNVNNNFASFDVRLSSSKDNLRKRINKLLNYDKNKKSSQSITALTITLILMCVTLSSCASHAVLYSVDDSNVEKFNDVLEIKDHYDITTPIQDPNITCGWGCYEGHEEVDMNSETNNVVFAFAKGAVVMAEYHETSGNTITIDHGNNFTTSYAHLEKIFVEIGQQVESGESIGIYGTSGMATGPHLGFSMRINNEPYNPEPFLQ